eukprot:SAG22_NODE_690_length_7891_cov_11.959322_8_plen_167_part_00
METLRVRLTRRLRSSQQRAASLTTGLGCHPSSPPARRPRGHQGAALHLRTCHHQSQHRGPLFFSISNEVGVNINPPLHPPKIRLALLTIFCPHIHDCLETRGCASCRSTLRPPPPSRSCLRTSFITSLIGYGLPVLSHLDLLTSSDSLIATSIPVELTCGLAIRFW